MPSTALIGRRPGLPGVAAFLAGCLVLAAAEAQPPRRGAQDDGREFRPRRVLGPQRAIVDAPVLAARDVRGQVSDNELVIGVVVEGEARAYPINMLTGPQREIVNDVLGGRAIAATW